MSNHKASIEEQKVRLARLEKEAKDRLEQSTTKVEKEVSKVLSFTLIAGGVLFLGYRMVKALTKSEEEKEWSPASAQAKKKSMR